MSENLKRDTAIPLAVQLGNDVDGNADVATSVNVHRPIPYGNFTEPVEMSRTSKAWSKFISSLNTH